MLMHNEKHTYDGFDDVVLMIRHILRWAPQKFFQPHTHFMYIVWVSISGGHHHDVQCPVRYILWNYRATYGIRNPISECVHAALTAHPDHAERTYHMCTHVVADSFADRLNYLMYLRVIIVIIILIRSVHFYLRATPISTHFMCAFIMVEYIIRSVQTTDRVKKPESIIDRDTLMMSLFASIHQKCCQDQICASAVQELQYI